MTDYEAIRAGFRLEVPESFNYTIDVVDKRAAATPAHPALVALAPDGVTAQRFDCAAVSKLANRAANFLESVGVGRGDRVLVQLPRIPEWYWVLLGCFKLGAIPLPGTTMLTEGDIEYRVNQSEATAAVADPDGAARIDRVLPRCPSLRSLVVVGPSTGDWISLSDGIGEASDERDRPWAHQLRRPTAHLFHLGDRRLPQDGAPHPRLVRNRSRDHGAVLARPRSGRPPLDRLRHRLGQGGMGQAVRAMAGRGGGAALGHQGQARPRPDAADNRRARGSPASALRRPSIGGSSRWTSASTTGRPSVTAPLPGSHSTRR